MLLLDLLHNAALLIALSAIYGQVVRFRNSDRYSLKLAIGVFFGAIAVFGMNVPVHVQGAIYDGRSIVLTLGGLFGGGTASIVAMLIAGGYRAVLGGAGMWAGLATIASCTLIGLVFRRKTDNHPHSLSSLHFYGIGLVSHAAMLACQLLIQPWPRGLDILATIWLPVLIVFPAATTLMAVFFTAEEKRTRLEERLIRSEERFRLAFHTSPDSININRLADGLYIDVNEGFCHITGYRREEVIGKSSLEIDIWADPKDRERLDAELRSHGVVRNLEATFQMKDGRRLEGLMSAVVIELDGIPHILSITRDISERKRLENELRQSERRYRTLFEDHSIVELLIDPETGRIVDANRAAVIFYGWSREELTAMNIAQINTLSQDEIRREMENARMSRKNYFQFQHRRADGSLVDVRVFSSPVEIAGKTVLHSIILDISNEKRLEAQLLQAQKMESVGQLAGGVAHDFNNLLQVMNGYAEILVTRYAEDPEIGGYVQKILDAGYKASNLVKHLLAFSRRQLMRPEVLHLNPIIEENLKMLRRTIGEHIDIRFVGGHNLHPVYADRTMMDQVLVNLCVNARDAMPEGGQIVIETENVFIDEAYRQMHPWAQIGRYVLLSVTDTGCGMSSEIMEHIFEPFFTTKENGKGTGLGLSTTYGIVKQHGGMIHVYSEEGKGTTFKIYLPISERSATSVGTKIQEPVPLGNETILVVEDSEEVRQLAREILEKAGYRVIEARDGQEAIEMIESGAVDDVHAYLLDVVMPKQSGWDVYKHLCSIRPGCRVLFMSGYSENAVHTNYVLKSGCHLVQKPFSRESLLQELRKVIDA